MHVVAVDQRAVDIEEDNLLFTISHAPITRLAGGSCQSQFFPVVRGQPSVPISAGVSAAPQLVGLSGNRTGKLGWGRHRGGIGNAE